MENRPNWTIYPDDVASSDREDYIPSKPRRGWTVKGLLGFAIVTTIVLWAVTAVAQTHDSAGRYILEGDPHARPAPHHSGGSLTGWAATYFLNIRDRGPFRIEGEWFSAGTMVLALVAGPSSVAGSCLGNVRMSFHGSRSTTPQQYEIDYANVLLPSLRSRFLSGRRSGQITFYRQMHLTQHDLTQMGYPVCED